MVQECKVLAPAWISVVFIRNLAVGWLLYGGWHWILYESPLHKNLEGKKFNEDNQCARAFRLPWTVVRLSLLLPPAVAPPLTLPPPRRAMVAGTTTR